MDRCDGMHAEQVTLPSCYILCLYTVRGLRFHGLDAVDVTESIHLEREYGVKKEAGRGRGGD